MKRKKESQKKRKKETKKERKQIQRKKLIKNANNKKNIMI